MTGDAKVSGVAVDEKIFVNVRCTQGSGVQISDVHRVCTSDKSGNL